MLSLWGVAGLAAVLAGCGAPEPIDPGPAEFVCRLPGLVEPVPPGAVPLPVTVINRTGGPVVFDEPPVCSCACTTPDRPTDRLAAGESMTVLLGIKLAGRMGPMAVQCRWADQSGRPWTARGEVTVYPRAAFDRAVVRAGGEAVFDQHWPAAEAPPQPPAFEAAGLAVAAEPAVEGLAEPGVMRRRTALRLATGEPAGEVPVLRELGSGANSTLVRTPPAVVAMPGRVDFVFAAGDDQPQERRVMVRDGRGLPLLVTAATSDIPGVTVEPGQSLMIRAQPGQPAAGRVRVEAGPLVVWVEVTVRRSL